MMRSCLLFVFVAARLRKQAQAPVLDPSGVCVSKITDARTACKDHTYGKEDDCEYYICAAEAGRDRCADANTTTTRGTLTKTFTEDLDKLVSTWTDIDCENRRNAADDCDKAIVDEHKADMQAAIDDPASVMEEKK